MSSFILKETYPKNKIRIENPKTRQLKTVDFGTNVRIHDLPEYQSGILPSKLRTAKIINVNWSFLQTIDLNEIINQFQSIKTKLWLLRANDTFDNKYTNPLIQ